MTPTLPRAMPPRNLGPRVSVKTLPTRAASHNRAVPASGRMRPAAEAGWSVTTWNCALVPAATPIRIGWARAVACGLTAPDRRIAARKPADDLAGEELANHLRGVLVRDRGANQADHVPAAVPVVAPHRQHPAQQALSDFFDRSIQKLGNNVPRIDGQLERRDQEAILRTEVVVDQRGVHAGFARDAADGRPVVTVAFEGATRGVKDRLPVGRRAGRASDAGSLSPGGHTHASRLTKKFNSC